MSTETYNGWANYPTWNVALWMDNEQGSYAYARELADVAIRANTVLMADVETEALVRERAVYDLAEALQGWHEESVPELEGFAADLHGWAMRQVDWREIAGHLVDELAAE
jgi:hypothetical protein